MVHCRIYGILKIMRRCNDVADSGEILFSGALLKRVADTGICACGTGCGYDSFLMSGQMVSILFLPFGAECVKKHKPLSRSVVSLRVRAMSRQFNLYFCCR